MTAKSSNQKTECEHEWRWMSEEDRNKRLFQMREKESVDPEQPNYEIRIAPVNAICDKCDETVWAHGYGPSNPKGWK